MLRGETVTTARPRHPAAAAPAARTTSERPGGHDGGGRGGHGRNGRPRLGPGAGVRGHRRRRRGRAVRARRGAGRRRVGGRVGAPRAARRDRHAQPPPRGRREAATSTRRPSSPRRGSAPPAASPPRSACPTWSRRRTRAERLEAQFDAVREKSASSTGTSTRRAPIDRADPGAGEAAASPRFKIFMVVDTGRAYPHMPGIGVHDHGKIMAIMEACAAADVPLMVHPHDQALMDHIEKAFWARGERDALAYARAYAANDGVIWETAIATLLRLQRATGVHLHLLHVQTAGSVDLIRERQGRGQKVTGRGQPLGAVPRLRLGDHRAPAARTPSPTTCRRRTCRAAVGGAARRHHRHRRHRPRAAHPRGEGDRLDRRLEGAHRHALHPVLPAACS